jgi:hypothetical protein
MYLFRLFILSIDARKKEVRKEIEKGKLLEKAMGSH